MTGGHSVRVVRIVRLFLVPTGFAALELFNSWPMRRRYNEAEFKQQSGPLRLIH